MSKLDSMAKLSSDYVEALNYIQASGQAEYVKSIHLSQARKKFIKQAQELNESE